MSLRPGLGAPLTTRRWALRPRPVSERHSQRCEGRPAKGLEHKMVKDARYLCKIHSSEIRIVADSHGVSVRVSIQFMYVA